MIAARIQAAPLQIGKSFFLRTTPFLLEHVRGNAGKKHWNPKFKKLRGLKVIKVELPDLEEDKVPMHELTEEDKRARLRKLGMQPGRPWQEKSLYLASTSSVFEPYVPPEGDGKISTLSTAGAKQKLEWLKKKSTSWKELRKIRKYDDEFELYPDFVDLAEDVYKKAHEALAAGDTEHLADYVTEKAYVEMLYNANGKTIRWSFVRSIEPPRVAHLRTTHILNKDNVYAQVTVRFHTQQTLAIYDRFGRLMYGSEFVPKDVLEYVVFEKHIVNQHGVWRIHHKIIPDWLPPKQPTLRTFAEPVEDSSETTVEEAVTESAQSEVNVPSKASPPPMATV